jgi:anti-sigma factor RsiW
MVKNLPYHRAPDNLRKKVSALAPEEARPGKIIPLFRSLSLAACLVLSLGLGWLWGHGTRPLVNAAPVAEIGTSPVVAAHLRALMSNHLFDVASTDQHTVKPWFAGKVDFVPPVVDYKDKGFPLRGGRLEYLDGHRLAVMVYGRRKHVIDMLVYPKTQNEAVKEWSESGFSAAHWASDGFDYSLVSGLNQKDLHEFIELIQGHRG